MSGEAQKLNCPNCGHKMVLRDGRRGKFWGCSNYPICHQTMDYREPIISTKKFVPSKYQQAVFDFIQDPNGGNAVVEAVAGSGKTTTIVEALQFAKGKVVFLAFNKKIATELSRRAPAWVQCSTLHSLGFKCLNNTLPVKPIVSDDKKMGIAKELFPDDFDRPLRTLLCRLASLVQNTLTDPMDKEALVGLIDRYSIETSGNGDEERIVQALPAMIREIVSRTGVIDFDDMIYLPIVLNLPLEKYDWVFGDEIQDWNASNIELVIRSMGPKSRFVGVGDTYQSIYGFRGADTHAMEHIAERTNAKLLPLSISYRCPISAVKLARAIVPHLEFAEWAIEGMIDEMYPTYKMVADAQSGDLVMCRINAPLVGACYDLIRAGKKATIAGRDIGKGLIEMIDKMAASSVSELLQKVANWRDKEVTKLTKAGKENRIAALEDKVEALIALCQGMDTLTDLRANIEAIFTDDVAGVVCSSVHRAKGLEADNTFILLPGMLGNSKRAKTQEDIEQEIHICYVAATRNKKRMVFVEGMIPAALAPATIPIPNVCEEDTQNVSH